jgi:hypothetical protein
VLRDGHAARLHLRRRPHRRRRCSASSTARAGHYHVSSGSDFSIKELFDATIAALAIELDERRRGPPRGEDDAYTILLDPRRDPRGLRLAPKAPLRRASPARSTTTASTASSRPTRT